MKCKTEAVSLLSAALICWVICGCSSQQNRNEVTEEIASPAEMTALFESVLTAVTEGRLTESLPLVRKALEYFPENPVFHLFAGRCNQNMGDHEGARESYERAIEAFRDFPKEDLAKICQATVVDVVPLTMLLLGDTLIELGETEKAISMYVQTMSFPGCPPYLKLFLSRRMETRTENHGEGSKITLPVVRESPPGANHCCPSSIWRVLRFRGLPGEFGEIRKAIQTGSEPVKYPDMVEYLQSRKDLRFGLGFAGDEMRDFIRRGFPVILLRNFQTQFDEFYGHATVLSGLDDEWKVYLVSDGGTIPILTWIPYGSVAGGIFIVISRKDNDPGGRFDTRKVLDYWNSYILAHRLHKDALGKFGTPGDLERGKKCIDAWTRVIEIHPEDTTAYASRAQLLDWFAESISRQGLPASKVFEEAVADAEEVIRRTVYYGPAYNCLGRCKFVLGNVLEHEGENPRDSFLESCSAFDRYISLVGHDLRAKYWRGLARLKLGEIDKDEERIGNAIEDLTECLESEDYAKYSIKKLWQAYMIAARIRFKNTEDAAGFYDQALNTLAEFVEKSVDSDLHYELGEAYDMRARIGLSAGKDGEPYLSKAISAYKRAGTWQGWFRIGALFDDRDDLEDALEAYRKAIELGGPEKEIKKKIIDIEGK